MYTHRLQNDSNIKIYEYEIESKSELKIMIHAPLSIFFLTIGIRAGCFNRSLTTWEWIKDNEKEAQEGHTKGELT